MLSFIRVKMSNVVFEETTLEHFNLVWRTSANNERAHEALEI